MALGRDCGKRCHIFTLIVPTSILIWSDWSIVDINLTKNIRQYYMLYCYLRCLWVFESGLHFHMSCDCSENHPIFLPKVLLYTSLIHL
jgi:hypothetical protein